MAAFAPLKLRTFRVLWAAALVSAIGTWMQNIAAAWEMTSLTSSSALVALVQSATTLPVVLVALPGGALADIVDRRKLLVAVQAWVLVAATVISALAFAGQMTPGLLLGLTFLLGLGLALWMPAWQAVTPELVPRAQLPQAVVLSGMSLNVARAVGPAIGGVVLAASSSGVVFACNALSCIVAVVAFARWRRTPEAQAVENVPPERLREAMRAGSRFVAHSPEMWWVMGRITAFVLAASALWALLPVVARHELDLGASGYGLLLGCIGAGAVASVPLQAKLRAALGPDRLAVVAALAFTLATVVLALAPSVPLVCAALAIGGGGWTATIGVLNTAAQQAVPAWVRARALAIYLLALQGSLAFGSAGWGFIAQPAGDREALLAAAGALVAGLILIRALPVGGIDADRAPWEAWPDPDVDGEVDPQAGPALVVIEYRVPPSDEEAFRAAMGPIEHFRRRTGADRWQIWTDPADPGRWVETYETRTWAEHLRQHQRPTLADQEIERAVADYRTSRPAVHLVAP